MTKQPKPSKADPKIAEWAAEHLAREMGCVVTVRAMRTKFTRQDLFAADVIGKRKDGSLVAIQATCGDSANVAHRRRKMEAVPWSLTDTVLIAEMRKKHELGNRAHPLRRYFRLHQWRHGHGDWKVLSDVVEIPKVWQRAWKPLD